MTDHALRVSGGSRAAHRLAELGVALAAIAFVLLAVAPLGWREGWWHFRTAFFSLMQYSAYIGAGAAVVSLIAVVVALVTGHRRTAAFAAVGLVAGAVLAYVPWSYWHITSVLPRIHDITTDTDNPPTFSAVMPARDAEKAATVVYAGPELAAKQKQAYPDIVPVMTALAPADAFGRALDIVKSLGWTLVVSDPAAGRIEASQTSFWFRFTDDVSIRVAARADGQPGCRCDCRAGRRIDIRSISRQGLHDFGVNAARIRAYIAALKQQPGL